jgi:hypothetical protein
METDIVEIRWYKLSIFLLNKSNSQFRILLDHLSRV